MLSLCSFGQTLLHDKPDPFASTLRQGLARLDQPGREVFEVLGFMTEGLDRPFKGRQGPRCEVDDGSTPTPVYSDLPFDASSIPPVYNQRYASYTQAVKLVNTVGIRNVYVAYFLGKVDLIKP
jgi:hypothetical protein